MRRRNRSAAQSRSPNGRPRALGEVDHLHYLVGCASTRLPASPTAAAMSPVSSRKPGRASLSCQCGTAGRVLPRSKTAAAAIASSRSEFAARRCIKIVAFDHVDPPQRRPGTPRAPLRDRQVCLGQADLRQVRETARAWRSAASASSRWPSAIWARDWNAGRRPCLLWSSSLGRQIDDVTVATCRYSASAVPGRYRFSRPVAARQGGSVVPPGAPARPHNTLLGRQRTKLFSTAPRGLPRCSWRSPAAGRRRSPPIRHRRAGRSDRHRRHPAIARVSSVERQKAMWAVGSCVRVGRICTHDMSANRYCSVPLPPSLGAWRNVSRYRNGCARIGDGTYPQRAPLAHGGGRS